MGILDQQVRELKKDLNLDQTAESSEVMLYGRKYPRQKIEDIFKNLEEGQYKKVDIPICLLATSSRFRNIQVQINKLLDQEG